MAREIKPVMPTEPPKRTVLDTLAFEDNLPKKKQKQLRSWTRTIIQIIFFLFLPSAYNTAFNGIKYIFTQVGNGATLEFTSFVTVLVVLLVYTIVFGRFFCGYACAFGSLGDWLYALHTFIAKKRHKQPKRLPREWARILSGVKYVVLTAIVVLCFTGLYGKLSGWNPWDAFSMLHARNFNLGKHVVAVILLLLLMVGMYFEERFFCKFLCPMGATFSLMPVLPFFALHRTREDCLKKCNACTRVCPADLELPKDGTMTVIGDCFQCGKCVGTCPKSNIHVGLSDRNGSLTGAGRNSSARGLRGNELWFTLVRAVLLIVLFVWLGV